MGACTSKPNAKPSCMSPKRRRATESPVYLYLLKSRTNTLLRYDMRSGVIAERELRDMPEFQEGQVSCWCGPGEIFCVGGVEDGFVAVLADDVQLTWRRLSNPPKPVAYGQMHTKDSKAFIFGALDLSHELQNGEPCPPLQYNLRSDRWATLPPPPTALALYGSAMSLNRVLVFGGFLDHPDYSQPSDSVYSYDTVSEEWVRLPVRSPLAISLPRCVFLDPSAVLVIGGHDPLDRFPESNNVFLFSNGEFQPRDSLPEIGKLRFCDTPVLSGDCVYLFSEDETIFKYSVGNNRWEFQDLTAHNMKDSIPTARPSFAGYGENVYRYERKTAEFVEFNVMTKSARKLSPSVFRVFPKWAGILVTSEGEVVVAGGRRIGKGNLEEDVDSVWLFSPSSRVTVDLLPLPERQHGLRLLQVGSQVYAISGVVRTALPWKSFSQVALGVEAPWALLPPMPYPTAFPGVGVHSDSIFCLGGESQTDYCSQFNLVQAFSLSSREWKTLTTEYPLGVRSIGVCSVSGGLLCFGGKFEDKSPCESAFLFGAAWDFRQVSDLPRIRGFKGAIENPAIRCGQSILAFVKGGPMIEYQVEQEAWNVIEI